MDGITLVAEGARVYIQGNTFALKDAIKAAGGHWDSDRKQWWVGKAKAAAIQAAIDSAKTTAADRKPEGLETIVAGRAQYQGHTYYLKGRVVRGRTHWDDTVEPIRSHSGSYLLVFRDGSKEFWSNGSPVEIQTSYQKAKTIAGVQKFAAEAKQAAAQGKDLGWRGNGCPRCSRLQDWCPRCAFDEFDN